MDKYDDFTIKQYEAVKRFYENVCRRAEENMEKTGRLEGAHYAAMQVELKAILESALNQFKELAKAMEGE